MNQTGSVFIALYLAFIGAFAGARVRDFQTRKLYYVMEARRCFSSTFWTIAYFGVTDFCTICTTGITSS